MDSLFLEVDFTQQKKHREAICGDYFLVQRIPEENRVIGVLSDGLGSGVKANILSAMTATMAMKFASSNMDFLKAAEIMMDALPVCQVRKISYATFTVVDSVLHKWTRVMQMDNPGYLLLREGEIMQIPQREFSSPRWSRRKIYLSEILNRPEDRLVLFSDGITQAGMGTRAYPLGWQNEGCAAFLRHKVGCFPQISAGDLGEAVLQEALLKEPRRRAGDDMTCGVLYFRKPRKLLLLTGPPFHPQRDAEYAALLDSFPGKRVICGGYHLGYPGPGTRSGDHHRSHYLRIRSSPPFPNGRSGSHHRRNSYSHPGSEDSGLPQGAPGFRSRLPVGGAASGERYH